MTICPEKWGGACTPSPPGYDYGSGHQIS